MSQVSLLGPHQEHFGTTERRDAWWLGPLLTLLGISAFLIYGTWAAWQDGNFEIRNRRGGWGQGLTLLTCFQNMLPALESEDRKAALYHGLSAVAVDSDGEPPRFQIEPLPDDAPLASLKAWFRQFVEVRDAEGAERCLVSAVRVLMPAWRAARVDPALTLAAE